MYRGDFDSTNAALKRVYEPVLSQALRSVCVCVSYSRSLLTKTDYMVIIRSSGFEEERSCRLRISLKQVLEAMLSLNVLRKKKGF